VTKPGQNIDYRTTSKDPKDKAKAQELGAVNYIHKPAKKSDCHRAYPKWAKIVSDCYDLNCWERLVL